MRHAIFFTLMLTGTAVAVAPGDIAPGFKLLATDGNTYDLKTSLQTHAAAVVVFMALKCPYSNMYNERYNRLVMELKKLVKPTAFFAVNSNSDEHLTEIKKHAEEHKFLFPVLKDEKHTVADLFAAEKTPEVFVISGEGRVIYRGSIDDDTEGKKITRRNVISALDEFYRGRKVLHPWTKSLGCSIK